MPCFPLIRQHDSMQCGVACLAMVCSHYGREYSLETLSKYCTPTAEGVSLLAVCDAAGKLGLHATAGRTVAGQLDATLLPCILHWRQNHFVVLYRVRGRGGKRRYFIADPAKGLSVYSEDDFLEAWASTGIGEQDNIRLRSEAVRKVIGTVPPRPVRMGTGFLCLIFAALLAAAALIPYPETVTAQAVMHRSGDNPGSGWTAAAEIPYSLISRIRPGMSATLELEGWPAADGSRARRQNQIPLQDNQKAEAVLLISDRSLMRMMLRKK